MHVLSRLHARALRFDAHARKPASAVSLVSPSQLLTGGADGAVCLWRLDEEGDSERRCAIRGHPGPVVYLFGDGEKVLSGARDSAVRVWEVRTRCAELRGFTGYLGSVRVAPTWLIADGTSNAVLKLLRERPFLPKRRTTRTTTD